MQMPVRRCPILALLALLPASPVLADEGARRPNVVIIYADDLGYGDLGCYGHPRFRTPELDRMAREGVRLTHFYSTCGYCAPSRASLMTGRYPFRNAMMLSNPHPKSDRGGGAAGDSLGLPADEVTLGEALQQAGYRTACIGKWHLGHKPSFYPTRNGFHEYYGILYSNDMHPVELYEGEKMVEYPVVQTTLTRRYTERALDFMRRNSKRPFFLYLPHAMPHKPLAPGEAYYQKGEAGLYGDVMAELSWGVGQILAELRRLKLHENTLVVFTSDNGPWYGGSTGGLRGMKSTWWEGGLRVPLIAWMPGTLPAGRTVAEPAIILDVFPTVLELARVPVPEGRLDGRSILPLLRGEGKGPHDALFSFQNGLRTVRLGKWKLHRQVPGPDRRPADWVDPRAPDGVTLLAPTGQYGPASHPGVRTGDRPAGWALFDLETDPAEQHDVSAQHPDVLGRLKGRFEQMDREVRLEIARAGK